jgi:hypothetical protein
MMKGEVCGREGIGVEGDICEKMLTDLSGNEGNDMKEFLSVGGRSE